jgi:hypothetical protein
MTLMKKQKNGGEITGILLGVLVPCCDCADIFFIVLTIYLDNSQGLAIGNRPRWTFI